MMKNFCSIAAYGRFFFFGMAYLGDLKGLYFISLMKFAYKVLTWKVKAHKQKRPA